MIYGVSWSTDTSSFVLLLLNVPWVAISGPICWLGLSAKPPPQKKPTLVLYFLSSNWPRSSQRVCSIRLQRMKGSIKDSVVWGRGERYLQRFWLLPVFTGNAQLGRSKLYFICSFMETLNKMSDLTSFSLTNVWLQIVEYIVDGTLHPRFQSTIPA